ncbi:MAG: T9SS type A sorting domain-containing protein [Bacteroidia bacterium]
MKKNILIILASMFVGYFVGAQTTATDFTATDCSGTSHNLFTELNAGKVIVVAMVHPCGSCVAPSVSAFNVVKNYATSKPGKVLFYLVDGNNNCTSAGQLTPWANTYGLGSVTKFSTTSVYNTSYYAPAMPSIMVFSGGNHAVAFRQDNSLTSANLTAAIDQAIITSGVNEEKQTNFQLSVYPNPASEKVSVNFFLNQTTDVTIDIFDLLGSKIKSIPLGKQTSGNHQPVIETETLNNGIYFLKLNAGEFSQIIRFSVTR